VLGWIGDGNCSRVGRWSIRTPAAAAFPSPGVAGSMFYPPGKQTARLSAHSPAALAAVRWCRARPAGGRGPRPAPGTSPACRPGRDGPSWPPGETLGPRRPWCSLAVRPATAAPAPAASAWPAAAHQQCQTPPTILRRARRQSVRCGTTRSERHATMPTNKTGSAGEAARLNKNFILANFYTTIN